MNKKPRMTMPRNMPRHLRNSHGGLRVAGDLAAKVSDESEEVG